MAATPRGSGWEVAAGPYLGGYSTGGLKCAAAAPPPPGVTPGGFYSRWWRFSLLRPEVAPTTCTTHFGSLASWAVSRFTVAMRIACNRERCSAISSSFSSLSCRGQPAPSRTPAPVGDGYSCCRALRGLWLFGAVLQGLRGAFSSTMRPATVAVTSLAWRASIWP
jgi:hypothetical protein